MAIQAYLDESGDTQAGQKILVIAGYIAPEESWIKFSAEWDDQLRKDKRPFFKVRNPKTVKRKQNQEAYYRIIEKYMTASVYCVVDVPGLEKAVSEISWPPASAFEDFEAFKKHAANPYCVAFREITRALLEHRKELGISLFK